MSYFKIPTPSNTLSNILSKTLLTGFCFMIYSVSCFAQEGYPEPEKTTNRLFYIQHSKNHNTYVYDANISNGVLNASEPVTEYEIVYTDKGQKRPLSGLQRRMAYGIIVLDSTPDKYKLRLAASDKISFYLEDSPKHGSRVYITVNNRKMLLDKMFVQLTTGFLGLRPKVDFVLLYGSDFTTGTAVVEKIVID